MVRKKEAPGTSLPGRKKGVPDIPRPEPGDNSWEDLAQISERFRQHTTIEIKKGNRLQASEKVWASLAYSIAAVGKQRDWEYDSFSLKSDILRQVGSELADANSPFDTTKASKKAIEDHRKAYLKEFFKAHDRAFALHHNFRNNHLDWPSIEEGQEMVAAFLGELAEIREKGYSQFTPINQSDQRRLARLNGLNEELKGIKSLSDQGRYLNEHFPLNVSMEWRSEPSEDDDNDDSPPVALPPSGSPPPTGGPANIFPKSGQGEPPKVNLKFDRQGRTGAADATPPPRGRRPRQSQGKGAQSPKVNIRFG